MLIPDPEPKKKKKSRNWPFREIEEKGELGRQLEVLLGRLGEGKKFVDIYAFYPNMDVSAYLTTSPGLIKWGILLVQIYSYNT